MASNWIDDKMEEVKAKAQEVMNEFYAKHSWMTTTNNNAEEDVETLYVNTTPTEVYDFDNNAPMSEAQWDKEYQEKFKTRKLSTEIN